MITESQKIALKKKIKKIIRESMFENEYLENLYREASRKKNKNDNDDDEDLDDEEHGLYSKKRSEVMKWLDSAQELHSVLSYKLWPDKEKDLARSLFSKKYRGEDADGNKYSFDDDDINKLFNMKDRYIDSIS